MNHPLQCRCGKLKGHVIRPGTAVRAVCYCKDCQAFARYLQQTGQVLDEKGGTAIVATLPELIAFTQGKERLACMSLSSRGLLRWYANCCNTPIANTPRDPKFPYVGLVADCLECGSPSLQQSFGGVRMVVNTASALEPVKSTPFSNVLALLTVMKAVAGARLGGSYRRTPFFTAAGTPLSAPDVLSRAERERVSNAA